ncbi:uncharacterized protein [Apostichopus japonicus]|uniref:uncharacterized protein isoform X1 n=1 Tax=Stichopus japonicus TaxID=307972 RepID=UPI003AB6F44A
MLLQVLFFFPHSVIQDAPLSDSCDGMEPGQQPIDQNAQVYAKSNGIIQREYQEEAVLYTAYAPNPFKSMPEREILDYKKEIADKTGQDVKQIELIVQAEETEIKETKEERGWREDQITENYNQDCDHSWRSTGVGRNDHSQYREWQR